MELSDVFIGQSVRHVRGDFAGVVLDVIEQPEPAPPHVSVRLSGGSTVLCAPINQLVPVAPPPLPGDVDGSLPDGVIAPRDDQA